MTPRPVNPRLGLYYSIVTSAFVSLVLVLALAEQLGMNQSYLGQLMIFAPLTLFALIGIGTRTLDRREFHTVGRRVPPLFAGLCSAAIVIGGIGFFSVTGALLFLGFDGLSIILGWTLGAFASAILFLPYLRKAGAYTVPGYIGQRFGWSELRWVAALCLLPSLWLLLIAELKLAALAASLFVVPSYGNSLLVIGSIVAIPVALGGLRSVTWSGCAQMIIALIGFGVPLAIAAAIVTNLPVPQITYGELFERLAAFETTLAQGAPSITIADALPGAAPEPVNRTFLTPFLSLAPGQFIALMLCFAMGMAVLPSLLLRAGAARSVFAARRGAAWGVLIVSLFAVTAPAYAAFVKFGVMQGLSISETGTPTWIPALRNAGLAAVQDANADGVISMPEVALSRDAVPFVLPVVSDFPYVIVLLVAISGIAIAMAAAAAHLFAIAASLSEDLYATLADPAASPGRRLLMARLSALAVAAMAIAFLNAFDIDVLRSACWAMSLVAGAFFPIMLLSVWWSRVTPIGALAAILTGISVTGGIILAAETIGGGVFLGVDSLVAGVLGAPASLIAGVSMSLATDAPAASERLFVEDMRQPEGESLFDRAARRATRTA